MEEENEIRSLSTEDINELLNISTSNEVNESLNTSIPVYRMEHLEENIAIINQDSEIISQPEEDINNSNELTEVESEINIDDYINVPIKNNDARFRGAVWFDKVKQFDIIIGGVGGIGSFLALLLSRLTPNTISLYDNDIISDVNMSGQFYRTSDIGYSKVESLQRSVRMYSDYYCSTCKELYMNNSITAEIMFSCFDNMEARKAMYNNWKNDNKELFIDGRLAFEEFQIFAIQKNDVISMETYEKDWLFDSSEAEPTLCSQKQTTHMASMIASLMTNIYINYCYNLTNPIMERVVPFLTRYDATLFNLKRF